MKNALRGMAALLSIAAVLALNVSPVAASSNTHSRTISGAYGYTYANWGSGAHQVRAKDYTNNSNCSVAIMDWDMVSGHGDARAAMACGQWRDASSGIRHDSASLVEGTQKRATCYGTWGNNVNQSNCVITEGSNYGSVPIGSIATSYCIAGYYKRPGSNVLRVNSGGSLTSCNS